MSSHDPADALAANPWHEAADAFAAWVAAREPTALEGDSQLTRLLELLGDVAGREVLDAGCGEGFLARILAARGARVTAIDVSPRLVALARQRDPDGTIDYRVADLSRPLPELAGRFPLIGSHLALNDVPDHRGFAGTLTSLARPGGRVVLAFNNPYSSVVRGHVADYFAPGAVGVYGGMSAALGRTVHYHHRTLEEYLDAFLGAGLRLARLVDVPPGQGRPFPFFMVLAFERP